MAQLNTVLSEGVNVAKKKKRKKVAVSGASCLADLRDIKVKLENGEEVWLNLAAELYIPDDVDELIEATTRAPARYAFWAYQTERALRRVRELERKLIDKEGHANLFYRKYYDGRAEDFTEDMIRSSVDISSEVKVLRRRLNTARYDYGIFRSMRDSMDHYNNNLRRVLAVRVHDS